MHTKTMNKAIPAANIVIDIQVASKAEMPTQEMLCHYARQALYMEKVSTAELTLRLVDEAEMQALNTQYRGRAKPTNVLSFPSEFPEEIVQPVPFLGDVVLCTPVVSQEAWLAGLPMQAHYAHMVVHGILHLLGFDHIEEKEAIIMEKKESVILSALGFPDPYGITDE